MSLVEIRASEARDVPAIQAIARAAWHAAYRDVGAPDLVEAFLSQNYSVEAVTRAVRKAGDLHLVAEVRGKPLGFCHVSLGAGAREVVSLCVSPSAWRRGVATALITAVEDHLAEKGHPDYFGRVDPRNPVALAFVARHAFARAAERDTERERAFRKHLVRVA